MCVSKIRCEEEEKNPASFNKFRFNPDIEKLHNGLVTKLALSRRDHDFYERHFFINLLRLTSLQVHTE